MVVEDSIQQQSSSSSESEVGSGAKIMAYVKRNSVFGISVLLLIILAVAIGFAVGLTVSPEAPREQRSDAIWPWTWECESQRCVKKENLDPSAQKSLSRCRATCGQYGSLWPHPTNTTVLGQNVLTFDIEAIHFQELSSPTPEVNTLLESATTIFQEKLERLLETGSGSSGEPEVTDFNIIVQATGTDTKPILWTDESYTLSLTNNNKVVTATITANTFFGARHGLESLFQLISFDPLRGRLQVLDSATIIDAPAYPHRGLSLDTSRNFFPLSALKRTISAMSLNKMNTLHWHVTDSHSWPIESLQQPEMNQWGLYSPEKIYRAADVRELVEYAAVRGVRIVPELDQPAHVSNGWQWGPKNGLGDLVFCANEEPWQELCVEPPCGQLNPLNDNVYNVLGKIYDDWLGLFSSDVFHMGGDEVSFPCWRASSEIKDWFELRGEEPTDDNLASLWNDFQTRSLEKLDEAAAKHSLTPPPIILWTSRLTADTRSFLDPSRYIIQVWTTSNDPAAADLANKGFQLIMTNYDALYFDCGFGAWVGEGNNWCSPYIGWQKTYENDPRQILQNLGVDANTAKRLALGGEGALWTEQADDLVLDSRLWPRGAALAERLWSSPTGPWEDAEARMLNQRQRMVEQGIAADRLQPEWCLQNEGHCYL